MCNVLDDVILVHNIVNVLFISKRRVQTAKVTDEEMLAQTRPPTVNNINP